MKKRYHMTGFLTVMMIFIIVLLTALGAMSLMYTSRDSSLSRKTAENLEQYYAARAEAERRLAVTDGCIKAAAYSGAFDFNIGAYLDELDFVTYRLDPDRCIIECYTDITDKTAVYWMISAPYDQAPSAGTYELVSMKTTDTYAEEEQDLNLWDGSFF